MRDIVFLNVRNDQGSRYEVDPTKPRGGSESYTDVWKLVALSGFKSIEIGEADLDNPNMTYLMFPANGRRGEGAGLACQYEAHGDHTSTNQKVRRN